ncbi:hypothetical protein [Paenibacillus daejeonensis]|uniref:hypothetical protein n=1 Tax=Paenibacillus daejeonensis TaxID=135193 RepID=UPI001B7FA701|nr:hypothetical protein [Paenibacillus daejeonensis]
MLFLVSCHTNTTTFHSEPLEPLSHQYVSEDEMFRLVLHLEKLHFRSDEKIELHATLEYLGLENKITIWHGLPYLDFFISDGEQMNTGGIVQNILSSTSLTKGKVYTFPFAKSGSFDESDPNFEFWRSFYNEKDLYLPPGNYKITAATNFSLTAETDTSNYNQNIEVDITVDPPETSL